MGAMEDEMRRAEELIRLRKEQQEKQELGSRRLGFNIAKYSEIYVVKRSDCAKGSCKSPSLQTFENLWL